MTHEIMEISRPIIYPPKKKIISQLFVVDMTKEKLQVMLSGKTENYYKLIHEIRDRKKI
jgi:hypothetical protein